jgi:hypothetical protein
MDPDSSLLTGLNDPAPVWPRVAAHGLLLLLEEEEEEEEWDPWL